MENGLITDAFITSSSHAKWYEPFRARLNHQSAWCKNLSEPSASYIQINTNATHLICAIATQGTANNSYPSFVKEYKLEFSFDGAQWDFYQGSNGTEVHQSHLFFVRASLCIYIWFKSSETSMGLLLFRSWKKCFRVTSFLGSLLSYGCSSIRSIFSSDDSNAQENVT